MKDSIFTRSNEQASACTIVPALDTLPRDIETFRGKSIPTLEYVTCGDKALIDAWAKAYEVLEHGHGLMVLRGQAGSGKLTFARALHHVLQQNEGGQSLIEVDCSALLARQLKVGSLASKIDVEGTDTGGSECFTEVRIHNYTKMTAHRVRKDIKEDTGDYLEVRWQDALSDSIGGTLVIKNFGHLPEFFQARLLGIINGAEEERARRVIILHDAKKTEDPDTWKKKISPDVVALFGEAVVDLPSLSESHTRRAILARKLPYILASINGVNDFKLSEGAHKLLSTYPWVETNVQGMVGLAGMMVKVAPNEQEAFLRKFIAESRAPHVAQAETHGQRDEIAARLVYPETVAKTLHTGPFAEMGLPSNINSWANFAVSRGSGSAEVPDKAGKTKIGGKKASSKRPTATEGDGEVDCAAEEITGKQIGEPEEASSRRFSEGRLKKLIEKVFIDTAKLLTGKESGKIGEVAKSMGSHVVLARCAIAHWIANYGDTEATAKRLKIGSKKMDELCRNFLESERLLNTSEDLRPITVELSLHTPLKKLRDAIYKKNLTLSDIESSLQ